MKQAIKIAKSEAKTVLANRMKTLAIIGIILMPLIYGFLYLWAFWDPYGNTQNINIAVVNEDLGEIYNNTYKNVGNEIIDNLKDNDNVTWVFTKNADENFWNGKYAAIITIPKDFTKNVISIKDDSPIRPVIYFQSRDSNGYILARIAKTVSDELKDNINDNITKFYIDELINTKDELAKNMTRAAEGAEDINYAITQAEFGTSKLEKGTNTLTDGADEISRNYYALLKGSSQIAEANKNLYLLSNSILAEYSTVTTGIDPTTATKLAIIKQKLTILANSENTLYQSSQQLSNNMNLLKEGSTEAIDGISSLEKGSDRINGGLKTIVETSDELASELRKSSDKINDIDNEQIKNAANIFRNPVDIIDISERKADNYGTGLAPYFIQLALWVGCLLTLMFINTKENRLIISKHSTFSITIGKLIVPAAIVTFQAIILDIAILAILGLKVTSIPLFVAFTILLSWTFLAIVQIFFFVFGKVGSIISIIVLMLQLTSASGTFPVSTSHPFFQSIAPFLPMTYGMTGLREIILEPIHIIQISIILIAFLIAGIVLRILITRRKLTLEDIRPRIQI